MLLSFGDLSGRLCRLLAPRCALSLLSLRLSKMASQGAFSSCLPRGRTTLMPSTPSGLEVKTTMVCGNSCWSCGRHACDPPGSLAIPPDAAPGKCSVEALPLCERCRICRTRTAVCSAYDDPLLGLCAACWQSSCGSRHRQHTAGDDTATHALVLSSPTTKPWSGPWKN